MVRGTGKFKQKRGGGRNFSRDMVLDENGTAVARADQRARSDDQGDEDDDEDDEEEDKDDDDDEDEEEEEGEGEGEGSSNPAQELTRAQRKELKKKQAAGKVPEENEEDEDLINPNHVQKKLNISDLGSQEMTRREREEKEKKEAKERYWKLHVQGKTQEAKIDLARLAKIRAERESAQAKRKAEAEAKATEIESKRKVQLNKRG